MQSNRFTFYDFLVDLIPGVVVIGFCLSILPKPYPSSVVTNTSLSQGVIILGFAYVAGQLLQAVASPLDRWVAQRRDHEFPFEARLSQAQGKDKKTIGSEFLRLSTGKFTTKNPESKATFTPPNKKLFALTQSYLLDNDIGRFRRFQIIYTFFRSLWVIFLFSFAAHLLLILGVLCFSYASVWMPGELLVISIVSGLLAYISYLRRVKYQEVMVDTMITDFYTHEVV